MSSPRKNETFCHGMHVLNSRHREVRRLKKTYRPSCHGTRVWGTSWLLVDYIGNRGLKQNLRVMEIGAGWGLPGLYCAKQFNASLTSVDIDWDVCPYLFLHSKVNNVEAEFLNESYDELTAERLRQVDLLIGADICFWEKLIDPLKALIRRALAAGVGEIILADPGRPTFNEIGDFCEKNQFGQQFYWRAFRPYPLQGQIIEIRKLKKKPAG